MPTITAPTTSNLCTDCTKPMFIRVKTVRGYVCAVCYYKVTQK